MTLPAIGQQTVFGLGEESTYGTAVAPTRFHPIISESLKLEKKTLEGLCKKKVKDVDTRKGKHG